MNMMNATNIKSSFALCLAMLLLAPKGHGYQEGDCYQLKVQHGTPPKTQAVRGGVPLTSAQTQGIQQAVDMIASWEANCGLSGPSFQGGPTTASEHLQELLNNQNICQETVGDPRAVGATASNPVTGNGGDPNAGGSWTTTGHPGINIQGGLIPALGSSGTYSTGQVALAALLLLHELSHSLVPNNAAGSTAEYEQPAYEYVATAACKIAGCSSSSQEEKDAACQAVLDANTKLCEFGKAQKPCDDCPNGGTVHCEVECSESVSDCLNDGARYFLGQFVHELYLTRDAVGSITLNRAAQSIDFILWTNNGLTAFTATFAGLDFFPVTFARTGKAYLLVGGYDNQTGEGKIVGMSFDPENGTILSQETVHQSYEFAVASSMDKIPGRQAVAILDMQLVAVFEYDVRLDALTFLADASSAPNLANTSEIHVWERLEPSSGLRVNVLWATRIKERYLSSWASLIDPAESVLFVDTDGDGTIDAVY